MPYIVLFKLKAMTLMKQSQFIFNILGSIISNKNVSLISSNNVTPGRYNSLINK